MVNMAGTSGKTDKENYSEVFASYGTRSKSTCPKKKFKGGVTFNIEAFSEYGH